MHKNDDQNTMITVIIKLTKYMHLTKNQLNGYVLGKTIGRGTFGKVKLATHKRTGQPVAIKILQKDKIKDVTDVERVSRQLHILKITQHSSIAQLYEIIETIDSIFIVMQFAPNGEFFDYVMDAKVKNEEEAHHYFVQMVAGLEYLHKLKISHRDVKPQNMLLDYKKRLKMVDFGLSNMYKTGQNLLTACGSPCYASPEMIKGQQYDPELTDVWSLGIVLFSMVFAKLPFEDDNTSILYSKIKSGLYVIDKKVSPQYKDLLSKMLNVKPKQRINLQKIKQHPWYLKHQGPKCNGVLVGFQNMEIDEQIIQDMEKLGYNAIKCKKYLQNNIRNQMTTAYYLLMKKLFIKGTPSPCDLCCQNFNKKMLVAKKSNIKLRSHSTDCRYITPNKETIQFQEEINPFRNMRKIDNKTAFRSNQTDKKYKRFNETVLRKERNCFSQIKSDDYEKSLKSKPSFYVLNKYGQTYGTSLGKSIKNHRQYRKGATTDGRESLSKSKKSDNSFSSKKKSLGKNIQNEHNISINVYINNAKIQTPKINKRITTNNSKHSRKSIEKQMLIMTKKSVKNINQRFSLKKSDKNGSKKRLKTQNDEKMYKKSNQSRRYHDDSYSKQQYDSKNFQKSNEVSLFEGSFWKKKSTNPTHKGYKDRGQTTQSRSGARNPHMFQRC